MCLGWIRTLCSTLIAVVWPVIVISFWVGLVSFAWDRWGFNDDERIHALLVTATFLYTAAVYIVVPLRRTYSGGKKDAKKIGSKKSRKRRRRQRQYASSSSSSSEDD